ncbi:hypothetical protein HPCPY1962_0469 [Helicobacter pylori CPY1962]|nr:hypothetical protein HPCPY1962_0469 [Helicobacter pylori CPY1962]
MGVKTGGLKRYLIKTLKYPLATLFLTILIQKNNPYTSACE